MPWPRRRPCGGPCFDLEPIRMVAAQVGERHAKRVVLHLPHVAELVDHERIARRRRHAKDDHPPRRIAVETAQSGEAKEPRRDDDPNAVDADRLIWPRFGGVAVLESGGVDGVVVFVFGGCEHAEGTVASAGVVEPVDVGADRGGEFDAGLPASTVE